MPNRVLLALAERRSIRRMVTEKRFTRSLVDRFVAGENLDSAIRASTDLKGSGIDVILDYLGEHVESRSQADSAERAYIELLNRIQRESLDAHISVKLTQLGLDMSFDECLERMSRIASVAAGIHTKVAIDMESHEHTSRTIDIYRSLAEEGRDVVLCLQAYLKRTKSDVAALLPLLPAIRLCKGAYNESSDIAFGRRRTRQNFIDIMTTLLTTSPYTAIATHDDQLIQHSIELVSNGTVGTDSLEFQMLFGVRRDLQESLVRRGFRVRVYVPFGGEWYPYLMRRLAERPANLRFFVEALLRG